MSKEYFQISQDDMYILAYINNRINNKLCLVFACDYHRYLKVSPHRPETFFSTAALANFVLAEFCKTFKMQYVSSSVATPGLICLDTNNYFYKNIKRIFGKMLASSPYFTCLKSEEGVNYYSLALTAELDGGLTRIIGTTWLIIQQIKDDFIPIQSIYRDKFLQQHDSNGRFNPNAAQELKLNASSFNNPFPSSIEYFFKSNELVLQKRKCIDRKSPVDLSIKKSKPYSEQSEDIARNSKSRIV